MYVPMRVSKDPFYDDWIATCRRCHQGFGTFDSWGLAMAQALGHMSMFHPQWPAVEPPC